MSRTSNTIKNYASSFSVSTLSSLVSVVSRLVFVSVLGENYLGMNSVASNLISMLSLAELGIGSAITFSLYKPLAEADATKIKQLMRYYRIAYRVIAAVVFVVGVAMIPFLDVLIKDAGQIEHLELLFFLYVVNAASSYLISYKTVLLTADQKSFKLTKINVIFVFLIPLVQIAALLLTKDYIIYILVQIGFTFLQRVIINRFVTKEYPVLQEKCTDKLPEQDRKAITKNVKALVFHKIGDYCVNGTDNLIIANLLSLAIAGYYSNYLLIFSTVGNIISMLFSSMTASFGNLLASEGVERKHQVFKTTNFIAFWLYGFSAVCFFNLCSPFIELVFGKNFVLSMPVLAVLVINSYMAGMRIPVFTVKSAAGIFNEDKYVPLIQAAINLAVSIAAAKAFGLFGVFLGTVVSGLIPSFYRPYLIYKKEFHADWKLYLRDYIFQFLVVGVIAVAVQMLIQATLSGTSLLVRLIISMLYCTFIPNLVFLLLYFKSKEMKYLINAVKGLFGRSDHA